MFPLHHQDELKRLSFSWYKKVKLSLQPLGEELQCFCVSLQNLFHNVQALSFVKKQ